MFDELPPAYCDDADCPVCARVPDALRERFRAILQHGLERLVEAAERPLPRPSRLETLRQACGRAWPRRHVLQAFGLSLFFFLVIVVLEQQPVWFLSYTVPAITVLLGGIAYEYRKLRRMG